MTAPRGLAPQTGRRPKNSARYGFRGRPVEVSAIQMPTTFKDYYPILGVPRTATEKEIRSAFRKLARKHHPDVNQGDKAAEDRFKEINEANEVLSDPEKRKKYDELGPRWQEYEQWERAGRPGPNPFEGATSISGTGRSPPTSSRACSATARPSATSSSSSSAAGAQARQTGSARRAAPAAVARRGEDVEGDAEISLEDAFSGSTLTVDMSSAEGPRRVEVKIPPGIHEGARVRAGGQGECGPRRRTSGRPLHPRPHPAASRLHPPRRRSPRTGCRRHWPPPSPAAPLRCRRFAGQPLSCRSRPEPRTVPACASEGLGMPHLKGGGAGDLVATVDVRLPHPTPEPLLAWAKSRGGSRLTDARSGDREAVLAGASAGSCRRRLRTSRRSRPR